MNYIKITQFDTANGLGIGSVLWVSGCEHNCPQCHNPQTHNLNAGKKFTEDTLEFLLKTLEPKYISRLTLSGGDPLHPENRVASFRIAKMVKSKFPEKSIWVYTGYEFDEIKLLSIIPFIDVLVDGKFMIEKKDLNLLYRGSSNQRLIDVQKTLAKNCVVNFNCT